MLPNSPHEKRPAYAIAVSIGLALGLLRAAGASAQAAPAFPEVPYTPARAPSYTWAYVAIASGIGLVGGSFLLTERADEAYQTYLSSTDPARIESFYDRAVMYDRLASSSLLAGESVLLTGLYLRFLRPPRPPRMALAIGPDRCALSWRF